MSLRRGEQQTQSWLGTATMSGDGRWPYLLVVLTKALSGVEFPVTVMTFQVALTPVDLFKLVVEQVLLGVKGTKDDVVRAFIAPKRVSQEDEIILT